MNVIAKIMAKLVTSGPDNGLEVLTYKVNPLRVNYDFEVVSQSHFDISGREYVSEEAFDAHLILEQLKGNDTSDLQLISTFDKFVGNGRVYRIGNKVDMEVANLCGFGVISMITGEHRDQKFLFDMKQLDTAVQLFAYAIIAENKINQKVLDVFASKDGMDYMRMVLGTDVFEMAMEEMGKAKSHP